VERVKDIIKVGQEIEARVIKVDKIERRIGLSIKAVGYDADQLRRETASFDVLRSDNSGINSIEQAFNLAGLSGLSSETEDWRPSQDNGDQN
jgi:small subunit ribosomal protein S1